MEFAWRVVVNFPYATYLASSWNKCFPTCDVRDLPLDQETVCEIVRVRLVLAEAAKTKQYRELRVRSKIVKGMANVYMQRHIQDLAQRPHVLKLLKKDGTTATPREVTGKGNAKMLEEHINARVDAEYLESEFGSTKGAIPAQIAAML